MSMPPPPPPPLGDRPTYPPYGQPFPGAPVGYAPNGQPEPARKNAGVAIAGFVLGIISLVPCFWIWFFQIPGVLGVIVSALGLKATRHGVKRGRGLAIAGLITALVGVAAAAAFSAVVYTSDDCVVNGMEIDCNFD